MPPHPCLCPKPQSTPSLPWPLSCLSTLCGYHDASFRSSSGRTTDYLLTCESPPLPGAMGLPPGQNSCFVHHLRRSLAHSRHFDSLLSRCVNGQPFTLGCSRQWQGGPDTTLTVHWVGIGALSSRCGAEAWSVAQEPALARGMVQTVFCFDTLEGDRSTTEEPLSQDNVLISF